MSPGNFRLDWPCQIRCVSLHLNDRIILLIRRYAVRIKVEFDRWCFRRRDASKFSRNDSHPNQSFPHTTGSTRPSQATAIIGRYMDRNATFLCFHAYESRRPAGFSLVSRRLWARGMAQRTGETLTDAVINALREGLERELRKDQRRWLKLERV